MAQITERRYYYLRDNKEREMLPEKRTGIERQKQEKKKDVCSPEMEAR